MTLQRFIGLLGAAAMAWPLAAHAQQPNRVHTIAVVMAFAQSDQDGQRYAAAFQEALQQSGWSPGNNLKIEYRWDVTDSERARSRAQEIASLKPDLVFVQSTVATRAIVQHTRDIPIVFTNVSDPLGERFVQSIARPGGNVTGFTNVEPTMGGKYLEILKETAPSVTRAAMLYNPKSTPGGGQYFYGPFEAAAASLSVRPIKGVAEDAAAIERVIAETARGNGGGLVVIGEPFTNLHRSRIVELTAQHHLPSVCPYRFYVVHGCLISYGVDFPDQFRRAASYVDRILKGDSPAHLPVQSPIKFEMIVNLKTAKALGLRVNPTLLTRADDVIE